jgi:3-oxoacyl-[acyl-carrier-protein] synthase III
MIRAIIAATGSCIPEVRVPNSDFIAHSFFEKAGVPVTKENATVIEKFREITGIAERRYAKPEQRASDLGYLAALDAIESSGIDRESIDYIIVAHNFGDVASESNRVDIVPSLASRIKYKLQIKRTSCVAYDIAFGCPGWLEGVIQANYFIRSGDAKRCLVIGTETLSRVIDMHDRDTLLYSDGGGAVILDASNDPTRGILAHRTETHASEHAMLLSMAPSYNSNGSDGKDIFLKMNGRKLYEFALNNVPLLIKNLLDKNNVSPGDIKKILIHQANEKMDAAIVERLYKLYNADTVPTDIMPMIISWLGNNSVATLPILLDLIKKNKVDGHNIVEGDKILFASVGAGMNINAVIYQY